MFAVKPCSAWAIAKRALGFGWHSFASSRQCTPLKRASKRLQRVTQWMSVVTSVAGSCRSSSKLSVSGSSTSPVNSSVQVARSTFGIAPVVVWRRGEQDFLVLTEPELGDALRALLVRMRLRLRCEIEPEEHTSVLVFGGEGIASDFPGAAEVLDAGLEPTLDPDELERRRIEAGVPRWGRELDDRVLPAEAGLDATHVSFSKGCYPGQEPIARLHYRGHPNRGLRVLELADVPDYD